VPFVRNSAGSTSIKLEGAPIFGRQPRRSSRPKRPEENHFANSFGVVYANGPAARAMSAGEAAKFPAGSVIVREKLLSADGTKPELLAVMVKRAAGFNPAGGDWEFLIIDGAQTRVRERQRKGGCLECHASQRDRDFVFPLPKREN
jgi:hypothetical protein